MDALSLKDLDGDVTLSRLYPDEDIPSRPLFLWDSYIMEVAEADSPPKDEDVCPMLPFPGLLF